VRDHLIAAVRDPERNHACMVVQRHLGVAIEDATRFASRDQTKGERMLACGFADSWAYYDPELRQPADGEWRRPRHTMTSGEEEERQEHSGGETTNSADHLLTMPLQGAFPTLAGQGA
jgi:hypothetical protein